MLSEQVLLVYHMLGNVVVISRVVIRVGSVGIGEASFHDQLLCGIL